MTHMVIVPSQLPKGISELTAEVIDDLHDLGRDYSIAREAVIVIGHYQNALAYCEEQLKTIKSLYETCRAEKEQIRDKWNEEYQRRVAVSNTKAEA
jgi:hypothetical protein